MGMERDLTRLIKQKTKEDLEHETGNGGFINLSLHHVNFPWLMREAKLVSRCID